MPKHRQMPGQSYKILSQDEHCARVEYRWLCPYCERQVSTQSAVYPADYERLETGGFYDALECPSCGKTADVRYWKTTRIEDTCCPDCVDADCALLLCCCGRRND